MVHPHAPEMAPAWTRLASVPGSATLTSFRSSFGALVRTWLRESSPGTRLEWVVEATPDGSLHGWLRGGTPGDLRTLAEASDLTVIKDAEPVPIDHRRVAGPDASLPFVATLQLGGPNRSPSRQPQALVSRLRWLAERGGRLRLRLRAWSLETNPELDDAQRLVRRVLAGPPDEWDRGLIGAAFVRDVVEGLPISLEVESELPLGPVERALLLEDARMVATEPRFLPGRTAPTLATRALAGSVLEALAAARAADEEELALTRTLAEQTEDAEASIPEAA